MARRRRSRSWSRYDRFDDYGGWGGFAPYVPVAARKAQAKRKLQSLRKAGQSASPIEIDGRKIARTFWGESWCKNLERYSDYSNRLPRGRTYVRNGSVIDLRIGGGQVDALVSGSEIYTVVVKVASVARPRWKAICGRCAGGIDSLVELLQGRFSKGVMEHLCAQGTGLFPTPGEITFTCSCPDWASMCKHVAAVLYGVGARLDQHPELLFRLRQVNEQDLLVTAGTTAPLSHKGPAAGRVLDEADLGAVFAVELADVPADAAPSVAAGRRKAAPPPKAKGASRPTGDGVVEFAALPVKGVKPAARARKATPSGSRRPAAATLAPAPAKAGSELPNASPKAAARVAGAPPKKAPQPKKRKRALSPAAREAAAARMREYWQQRRGR